LYSLAQEGNITDVCRYRPVVFVYRTSRGRSVNFVNGITFVAKKLTCPGSNCVGRRGGAIKGLPFGRGDKDIATEEASSSCETGDNERLYDRTRSIICFLALEFVVLQVEEFDAVDEAIVDAAVEAPVAAWLSLWTSA